MNATLSLSSLSWTSLCPNGIASIINTELKKAAISFITAQNYKVFGTVLPDPEDGIPQITAFDAIRQGNYADFFKKDLSGRT